MDNREKKQPLISVIMGIYNCEDTLEEAVESIINQSITDWELIMCDDGSSDSTYSVAQKIAYLYSDKIILLKNEKNMGLNYTLNKCLEASKGFYIARMDGDDRCDPVRFKKELDVLLHESDISIVSSDMQYFDESGIWGYISHPTYPERKDFLYGTPFCHAPCLVRREAFMAVKGYSESKKLLRVEDYHLWIKMYQNGYKGKNIHEPLYQMRDDRNAYSRRKFRYRLNEAYVKILAIKELKLPLWGWIFVMRPLVVGLLPKPLYHILHKYNLK